MLPHCIRLACREDAAPISRWSRDLIETGLGWRWTAPRVARAIADPDTCTIVLSVGSDPVGFAITGFHDEHAHLSLLAIDPAWQRQGLGRELVNWIEQSARTAGIATVHLEARASNTGARRFYAALGYREMFEMPGYYGGRESAVRLMRDIRRLSAAATG